MWLIVAAAVCLVVCSPASAMPLLSTLTPRTVVPTVCAVSADVSQPANGVRVSGAGFTPQQKFTIYLRPEVLAKPVTDKHGGFALNVSIPAGTIGPQTLQIEGAGCAVEVRFVAGEATPPTAATVEPPAPSRAPTLGLSTGIAYSVLGLVLAAAILMFLLASRAGRRRSPNRTQA